MKRLLALPILIAALTVASFATVSFSPSSLPFGSQPVGSTSAVKFVTFSNSASTSVSFGTKTVAGDYTWGGVGTCGPTLAANSNCTMSVIFKPTASGTRTGLLTAGSMVVSLTGTGGSTTTPPVTVQALKPTTTALTNGTIGKAYSAALTATGGTSPYKWSVASGTLPAGLALSATGAISGTPTASGAKSFSVAVKDSATAPQSATATLTLTVAAVAPVVTALKLTTATLSNGAMGSGYSATLQAGGGTAPYKWSVASGSLPGGLTLSSGGTISGTPTKAVASSFSVTVKDSEVSPQAATSTLALTIISGSGSVTPPTGGSSTLAGGYATYITKYKSYSSQYYVSPSGSDNNSGSQSSPWASLGHADSAAPSCSVVWLEPGTYTLSGSSGAGITTSSSGSSTCHKAYVSTTYGGALLRPAGSGNGYAAWVENGNYTDHAGFDINDPNGCEGFYGGGPTGGVYVYNIVHDIANGGAPASGQWCWNGVGGGGIEPGTNHGTIADNVIYNVGYPTNMWTHGIYIGGGNMQIFNNLVYNSSGACIQDYNNSENDVIVNNTLVNCNTFGIVLGAESCSSGTSGGDFIANNIFDSNAGSGNLVTYCGSGSLSGNTYTNNLNYGGGSFSVSASNTITSNPNFVNLAQPGIGNFQLQSSSPAIGAGTHTSAPTVDIEGTPRGNSPSIGAYE